MNFVVAKTNSTVEKLSDFAINKYIMNLYANSMHNRDKHNNLSCNLFNLQFHVRTNEFT